MTGTDRSSWARMRPCETASAMYSKCMVSPLIRTPMAMMASKGAAEAGAFRAVRSVVEEPRRSPALPLEAPLAWTCEAVYILDEHAR